LRSFNKKSQKTNLLTPFGVKKEPPK